MSDRRCGVLSRKICKVFAVTLLPLLCTMLYILHFMNTRYSLLHSNSWKLKASAKVDQTSTGKVADHQRPVINSPQKFPAGLKQEISGDILCDDYQWPVSDPAHRHPNEVKHVVFVKVHKAASTTIFNMLIRFSMSRDLNVMFPLQGNLLSETKAELQTIMPHPPSPPFRFDILCHHVLFRKAQIRRWFPDDTRYVTILRQPWHQLNSAFKYYKTVWPKEYLMEVSTVTQLVENWRLVEPFDPLTSYTNNRMSIDLGLPPEQIHNSSYVSTFVDDMHSTFDLVLIVERFDESLVLMKRRFRWTMKDIVYMKLNSLKNKTDAASEEPDAELKEKFLRFSQFDIAVYNHFVEVLEQAIENEGTEFSEELQQFTVILKLISGFCDNKGYPAQIEFPRTRWNEPFAVPFENCAILTMSEMELNVLARYSQRLRMMAHSCYN